MQIDSIKLFHVAVPLKQPVKTAGRQLDALETVLVRMQSGEVSGWGEAAPGNAPTASAEWAAGVFGCLKDWLVPAVVGTMIDSGEDIARRLAPFRDNQFARSALDAAWWDLNARLQEKPLHELLGGTRNEIELGTTFDQMESIDEFLASIAGAFEAGFARVRLMFRPGWDIQMVDAVRKEFPVETIHVDGEGAMGLEHVDTLQRLDDFGLAMIEQPLSADDLVGAAMVQESVSTPLCLDESITSVAQAEVALELNSCRYMNLTPGRVGGLTPAVAIHDACSQAGVPCFVGATPQSAIGTRHCLALASKENFTYPADFFPSADLFEQDLAEQPARTRDECDGTMRIALWSEPGIGVEPDAGLLKKFSVSMA